VKANLVTLKLIHFTDKLINDYCQMLERNQVQLPSTGDRIGFTSFLQTEEERRSKVREVFEKLSTAKMTVDGIVVPQVHVARRHDTLQLSFMTSVNKLYTVEFDCFYFDPRSNVRVLGPYTINVPGSVNAMDFVQTYKSQNHDFEFAVGTFLSRYNGTEIENETVHLIQGDP